jgi:hypothetical protein
MKTLAILGVVLFTMSTASADCGWVLWRVELGPALEVSRDPVFNVWRVFDATDTLKDCRVILEKQLRDYAESVRRDPDARNLTVTVNAVTWNSAGGSGRLGGGWLCLPAGTDPRPR